MNRTAGLLMLLLLAFLVSQSVAAEGVSPSNDPALGIELLETKTIVQEEVNVVSVDVENMAVESVAPVPAGCIAIVVNNTHTDYIQIQGAEAQGGDCFGGMIQPDYSAIYNFYGAAI